MTMGVPDFVQRAIQDGQYGQAGPMSVPEPNASTAPYAPQFVMDAVNAPPQQPQAGGMSMPGPNASGVPYAPDFVMQAVNGQSGQSGGLPAGLDWQPTAGAVGQAPKLPSPPPQAGGMSVPEPSTAPMSSLNYTPAEPPPEAPQQPDGSGVSPALAMLLGQAGRGTQQVVPARTAKALEQWEQHANGPMPGSTPAETAANRAAWDAARQNREETENEALLNRREELMGVADRADEQARREILRGRGYAQQMLDVQKEQTARKQAIDNRIFELDHLIEQQATARNVNPAQKYWTDMGAFGRLATGLALGFGAMGQALAGGQNVALELVNREIDGEFARQRDMVDGLGLQIASKRALLGDMLQKFQSPEAAEAATRSALIGQAEVETRRQAATEKSAEAKAEMTSLADQLALQRAGLAQSALEGEHRTLYANVPAHVAGKSPLQRRRETLDQMNVPKEKQLPVLLAWAERGPEGAAEALHNVASATNLPQTEAEVRAANFDLARRVDIPGVFGGGTAWAYSPERAGKAAEGLESADQLIQSSARLRKIVLSGSRLSPDDRMAVDQIAATNAGQWRVALGLGVMSESDKDLISPLTGERVNRMSIADRIKMLDTNDSLVRQKAQQYTHSLSADPMGRRPNQETIRTRPTK
jgi:hypothetical protein